jgi:hypothetical protein
MYVTVFSSALRYYHFLMDFWFRWEQGEPYHFTHLIILSRVYHLSEEEESELANSAPPARLQGVSNAAKKMHKKQRARDNVEMKPAADGIYSFHPEDDIIIKVRALAYPNDSAIFDTPCSLQSTH